MTTFVQGNVASGATDEGNPLKIGGVFRSTPPTVTDGQRVDQQFDNRGNAKIALANGASTAEVGSYADSGAAGSNGVLAYARSMQFNGTSWDRTRNNLDVTLLASAARTATLQSSDQTNYNGRGLHVVLDVTSAGTGSITLTIQAKDALSGKYYTLLAGAAVTTNSTNVYKVYPGFPATANVSANDLLPRTWRIDVTHNNGNSITYSVGASVIL